MSGSTDDRPGEINARSVRHPGRWVAVFVILVLVAMMLNSFITNPRWGWGFAFETMFAPPVLRGLIQGTIVGTIGAMILGVTLGVLIAIMRLSDNPVLRWVSFAYTWFFRGIPRYVLLATLGVGLIYLYPQLHYGLPFGMQIAELLGLPWDGTFGVISLRDISSTIIMGIIGLGLSEAAYMAEIARAGILSVDKGQTEAAQALGMKPRKIMWRIVLPQAMRVIVPPTGNEAVAMIKDTSLLMAIPVINELFYQTTAIGNRTYQIMPTMVAATVWYLIISSLMMVVQHYLERRFGRGFGTEITPKQKAETILARTGEH